MVCMCAAPVPECEAILVFNEVYTARALVMTLVKPPPPLEREAKSVC
jgi:hypothetical protein